VVARHGVLSEEPQDLLESVVTAETPDVGDGSLELGHGALDSGGWRVGGGERKPDIGGVQARAKVKGWC
jgi:hypothetical protein